jgi:DNA mismatch repair protein PMS2
LDSEAAEEKLSLTISKSDFSQMKIIGQFNLGFILASRSSAPQSDLGPQTADDLFIIDQHASDEKYNFERLQATTIVQSQRLVYPKTLDLTAMEEEIVIENLSALETNGFVVSVDQSGESPIGQRCQLVSLPLSRETAFSLTDLDELLALLSEAPPGTIPRPSKVRKMFAMRACRSSIMIGRTLTHKQMGKVVQHLGELDKPWNCPHGRPTMRHLSGLGIWDELGWKEHEDPENEMAGVTDWAGYIRQHRGNTESES